MKSTIAFRVDSGFAIGSGHVMRCLTLAKALAAKGRRCVFICRPSQGSMEDFLRAENFEVIELPTGRTQTSVSTLLHSNFLSCSQLEDAEETAKVLSNLSDPAALVVDHYGISEIWDLHFMGKIRLFKIDDLADRSHHCTGLIDQNFYSDMETRYDELVPPSCIKLLGPKYAILRNEFSTLKSQNHENSEKLRILISFGSIDTKGFGVMIANEILEETNSDIFVLGRSQDLDLAKWEILKEKFRGRITGPRFVKNSISHFTESNIYVGAGGTITWERFAVGLPGIVYSIAQNQVQMARDLDSENLQVYAGPIENFSSKALKSHLKEYSDPITRESLSAKMRKLVDGQGAERVIDSWKL